ncbi:hypothetical protein Y032_0022g643 [Ancylostoma ceylanicum]|uniref:Uncharacterized protein n=1 Tax=Ancylostoma ceylanicum TaxID=53326 RepID=A0A016UYH9_9BILA|nr:hypothetical protein Y032_0022g643 [Ancylostoma ceylanicum]
MGLIVGPPRGRKSPQRNEDEEVALDGRSNAERSNLQPRHQGSVCLAYDDRYFTNLVCDCTATFFVSRENRLHGQP